MNVYYFYMNFYLVNIYIKMMQNFRIPGILIDKDLGSGGFSKVYLGKTYVYDKEVAIKVFSKEDLNSKNLSMIVKREVSILKKLKHPFIIDTIDTYETNDYFCIINEYCPNGTLLRLVKDLTITEEICHQIYTQLVGCMEYYYKNFGIIHRDIKLENILLDENYNIRLADFGLATVLEEEKVNTSICGTAPLLAPEVITNKKYGIESDIWSSGIVLYNLVYRRYPFDDKNTTFLYNKICEEDPEFPDTLFAPELIDLLKKLLVKDPSKRITLDGIKKHPWIKSKNIPIIGDIPVDIERYYSNVDEDVLKKVSGDIFDIEVLRSELTRNVFNESVILYRLFCNEEIQKTMSSLLKSSKKFLYKVGKPADSPKLFSNDSLPSIQELLSPQQGSNLNTLTGLIKTRQRSFNNQ